MADAPRIALVLKAPASPAPKKRARDSGPDAFLNEIRRCFNEAASASDGGARLRSDVASALERMTFDKDSWARYIHFGDSTYSRNLVAFEGRFSIILNCWRRGQCTPEHDHSSAGGSTAWIKVLSGSLVLTRYGGNGGLSQRSVASNQTLGEGSVGCHLADELGMHMITNRDSEVAISLHVFSPPMLNCCGNPVVLCQRTEDCITETERLAMHARSPGRRLLYTNFRALVQTLHNEIQPLEPGCHHPQPHIDHITTLLASMRFNRAEFSRYLNFRDECYTRNLVGYDVPQGGVRAKFTALILCWNKGQMSPIHDHAGSSCWVKVLQGQLREVRYEYRSADDQSDKELAVLADRTFEPESVAYINDTQGVHAMGNPNPDTVTVSLHVYAPPYVLCKMFDPKNGSTKEGSMAAAIMPKNPFAAEAAASAAAQSDSTSPSDAKRPRLDSSLSPSAGLADTATPMNLWQLQTELKRAVRPDGSCEGAAALLRRLVLAEHEWKEFVHFEKYRYTRSLVALDASFSLMVLCWNKGHATPLHSHAHGVCSWAKVLSGSLVLKRFKGSVAEPVLSSEHSFGEGDILDEQEYSGLHIVGNPSSTGTTVSLHLYSPPYVDMAHVDSAGRQHSIPVVHSATSVAKFCGLQSCEQCGDGPTGAEVDAAVGVSPQSDAADDSGSPRIEADTAPLKTELRSFGAIFSDFHGFVNFMRAELNPDDVSATTAMLEGFCLHESEWREYVTPPSPDSSRQDSVAVNLIAQGDNSADRLELCAWAPGTQGPAAAAGGRCWLKVLSGDLEETEYASATEQGGEPVVVRRARLLRDSVTYFDQTSTASLGHPGGDATVYALRLVAGPTRGRPGRC